MGPPPLGICAPFDVFPAHDPAEPWAEAFGAILASPPCDDALWSPTTDQALRDGTIAIMQRHNIVGVLSGTPRLVGSWLEAAPERFIPGLELFNFSPDPSPEAIRRMHESGELAVLAEVSSQYRGLAPDAPELAPYWSVAEELDIPVGIHIHPGVPGNPYLGQPTQEIHSPLLLEKVLLRHPRLRVYVIHAGWPQLDDMITLMYAHPQVYVDIGGLVYLHPRADFYRYLRGLVEAGFGNRVMFGSDQMIWPQGIERAIQSVENAPFLSEEQKRAIFYDNAARFLRLSDEVIDLHHSL